NPEKAVECWIPARAGMLDSRLRGNDGHFDRLVLKKARGGTKAWPDVRLRSIGRQYSSPTCQDFSHFFVSRRLGANLV
ncbi:MAG: hypothetical protein LBQ62_07315, partial [Candidatus Accumulibacter sp.]|nr:hypothetical protein [Accumulibacter sp.]